VAWREDKLAAPIKFLKGLKMDWLQIVNVVASSTAAVAGLRIVFMAGRLMQKVDDHGERIERLEGAMDTHH
jgi:hypothetical protein